MSGAASSAGSRFERRPWVETALTSTAAVAGGPSRYLDADVVVTVGTDHHPFDRLMGWVEEWCGRHPGVDVVVQRGYSRPPDNCQSYDLIPHAELCRLFSGAKVVIGHGGPSTVMDVRMAGRLPVVLARDPGRGEHVDDHQIRFARHLARHGMARIATTKFELWDAVDQALADPERFEVDVGSGASEGVVRFGRLVEDLLRVDPAQPPSREVQFPGLDRWLRRSG